MSRENATRFTVALIKKITVRFGKLKYGRNANSTGMNPSVLVGLDCFHSLGRFLSVLRVGADLLD
jgi:hypothetical protein